MIHIYYKADGDTHFEEIARPKEGCWIHVEEATPSDITQICELIGLEYTDIYDCFDRHELPRIERIKQSAVLFTRHPSSCESGLYTSTFTVILSKHYFITISPQKNELVTTFLENSPKLSPAQQSKFLVYILLKITQEYTTQIKKIRTHILQHKRNISKIDRHAIANLTQSEELLNQYLSALVPLRSALKGIVSGKYITLQDKNRELLEDLINANMQSEELCTSTLHSIRTLRDSCGLIFSHRLYTSVSFLTSLVLIAALPTLTILLYALHAILPSGRSHTAFYILIAAITGVSILCTAMLHRKKWI